MSSYYRKQLEEWLKTIDVKAKRVLDVGGSQLPIKNRVQSWAVEDYKILDLKKPHQGNPPDICANIDDIIIINEKGNYYRSFDIIFCLEVMEYVINPMRVIGNIGMFIKHKGTLYISFPFIYPIHEPIENDYLRYTRKGIEKLLNENNFEIVNIIPRTEKGNLKIMDWFFSEKMRPSKNYHNHNEVGYLVEARSRI